MSMDVRPGSRVRLISMPSTTDPDPIDPGSLGTVLSVTEGLLPQIEVQWDSGRALFLLPDIDQYEVIGHSDLVAGAFACPGCQNRAMALLEFDELGEQVTCGLCGTEYEP